jgi:hypothetical protein
MKNERKMNTTCRGNHSSGLFAFLCWLSLCRTKLTFVLVYGGFTFFIGCGEQTGFKRYQTLVKRELAKNERNDSLFFDIHFGMTGKAFYMHCWEMNKKGLFTDGEGNTAVLYRIKEELKYPASMNFYPEFRNDKISKMGVSFRYEGWAPWNKDMFADSLRQDILRLYTKWYPGNPFIEIKDNDRGIIYVKVDGNRRIIIGSYDDTYVKVDYTDLLAEKSSKEVKGW